MEVPEDTAQGAAEQVTPVRLATCVDAMRRLRGRIEVRLEQLSPHAMSSGHRVAESMGYSLLGGGKRLRPVLTVLSAQAVGGDPDAALDPACAVEMVHTASLIFDDLPCMDDATLRRGRRANHRVFGDDVASLAAVTLISEAFAVIARCSELSAALRVELVAALARAIGLDGLAGGQASDLEGGTALADPARLEQMELQKTGTLFVTSAQIGARVAGAGAAELDALTRYARHAGLAFQIFDDLLDTFGDRTAVGKDLGLDGRKATFSSVLGRRAAESLALDRCREARVALAGLHTAPDTLSTFVEVMIDTYRAQTRRP